MEGFLPLIEGFLAFALTMLALTTAVSALVAVVHRTSRSRARGLREMVRVLYLTEIRDLLLDDYLETLRSRSEAWEKEVGTEKEETTGAVAGGPRPSDLPPGGALMELRDWWRHRKDVAPREEIDRRLVGRAEFIHDMTLMPLPRVVSGLDEDKDYWKRMLESAERLSGRPLAEKIQHPIRWLRRWRTLGCGLEALTDEEFKERLAGSEAGRHLKQAIKDKAFQEQPANARATNGGAAAAWARLGVTTWEELETHLLKMFRTIGLASSESFARTSRVKSVVVGFVLAFAVNVDSIDLLNSYLTDPELRARVLAQSEEILAPEPAAPDREEEPARSPEDLTRRTDRLNRETEGLLEEFKGQVAASGLDEEQAEELIASLEGQIAGVVEGLAEVESGLGELQLSLTEARGKVQGTVRALTASFPVGWSRFPNCSDRSPDLRCAGRNFVKEAVERVGVAQVKKRSELKAQTDAGANSQGAAGRTEIRARLEEAEQAVTDTADQVAAGLSQAAVFRATLGVAREEARADYFQWLAGVLLTGVLLGLGTPFWIQVVNSALELRRWVEREDKKKKKAGAGKAPPPEPEPNGEG